MNKSTMNNVKQNSSVKPDFMVKWKSNSLTKESLERLRNLVERQRMMTCTVPDPDTTLPVSSNVSDVDPVPFNDDSQPLHYVTRKVKSGVAPPTYPGFSFAGASPRDPPSGCSHRRSYPRRVEPTHCNGAKHVLKRRTSYPEQRMSAEQKLRIRSRTSYNPDSWRVGRDLIREHLDCGNTGDDQNRHRSTQPSHRVDSADGCVSVQLHDQPVPDKPLIANSHLGKHTLQKDSKSHRVDQTPIQHSHNHESCCSLHRVTRSDLQALVRKQREARRAERLNIKMAEAERRERIQQNLSSTAKAAGMAARAKCIHTEKTKNHPTEPQLETATFLQRVSVTNYSEERAQRLNALLDEEQETAKADYISKRSRRRIYPQTMEQKHVSTPSCKPEKLNTEPPVTKSNHPGQDIGSMKFSAIPTTPVATVALHKEKSRVPSSKHKTTFPKFFELTPNADEFPEITVHPTCLIPLDETGEHETTISASSEEDSSPPPSNRWIRLEAVGASEPEVASGCESEGEIVDDLVPIELEVQKVDTKTRSIVTQNRFDDTTPAQDETGSKYRGNELRRLIYTDPLRFAEIRKRYQRGAVRMNTENKSKRSVPSSPLFAGQPPSEKTASSAHSDDGTDSMSTTIISESKTLHQSPPNALSSSQSTSNCQREFLIHVAQQAISSTPCRDTIHSALSVKQPHDVPLVTPRLTAAALKLKLSAELYHLEALDTSIQHLAEMDSLRQFAMAQAQAAPSTQTLKVRQSAQQREAAQRDVSCDQTLVGKSIQVPTPSTLPVIRKLIETGVPPSSESDRLASNGRGISKVQSPVHSEQKQHSSDSFTNSEAQFVDSQVLAKVKSELNDRAANLKLRRERAQNLITMTRNLEKEEEKVTRLERDALKAMQRARKRKRHDAVLRSPKTSHMTDAYVPDFTDPASIVSASHSRQSVPSVSEAGDLRSQKRLAKYERMASKLSASVINSTKASRHLTSSVSEHVDHRTSPLETVGSVNSGSVKALSYRSNHRCSGKSQTSAPSVLSSACDNSSQSIIPLDPAALKLSGGNSSSGSHDAIGDHEIDTLVDGSEATHEEISVNTSKLVDVSAMESRVRALHGELKRQELMLSKIKRLSKHYSTDRLARLQTTLMQHQKLCDEIINNIKNQLSSCQSTILSQSTAKYSSLQAESTTTRTSINQQSSHRSNDPTSTIIAEDIASATDTEGDLQKLDFDEKTVTPMASPSSVKMEEKTGNEKSVSEATIGTESHTLTVPIHSQLQDQSVPVSYVNGHPPTSDQLTDIDFENGVVLSTAVTSGCTQSKVPMYIATHTATDSSGCDALPTDGLAVAQTSTIVDGAVGDLPLDRSALAVSVGTTVISKGDSPPRALTRSPTVQLGSLSDVVQQSALPSGETSPVSQPCKGVLPSPQALVDEVTDKLFASFLAEAVDAVVNLNRDKADMFSFINHGDHHTTDLTTQDSDDQSVEESVEDKFAVLRQYLPGCVLDVPSRTDDLIHAAVDFLWNVRSEANPGCREAAVKSASPPEVFNSHWIDPMDLNPEFLGLPNARFISRLLIFDLVAEAMDQIFGGEDDEYKKAQSDPNYRPRVTSSQFRLWNGPTRPQTKEHLSNLVQKYVEQTLRLRASWLASEPPPTISAESASSFFPRSFPGTSKLSRTAQWTLSKKPFLAGILELELRAEEGAWLSYTAEETQLKCDLFNQIWQEMLHDALDSMIQCYRGSHTNSIEL